VELNIVAQYSGEITAIVEALNSVGVNRTQNIIDELFVTIDFKCVNPLTPTVAIWIEL